MTGSSLFQSKPTPTILLALDTFAIEVMGDVQRVFVQEDAARQTVTLGLALDGSGNLSLLTPASTNSVLDKLISEQAPLPVLLEEAMRLLRTDEVLARAGLAELRNPPLDVFILGDLRHRETAQALFPALALVDQLLASDPYGEAHLFLNIARFASDDEHDDVDADGLISLLKGLGALRSGHIAAARESLKSWVNNDVLRPIDAHIYLFDRAKEGRREVRDIDEIRTIMGNVLMAFMSAGLAQEMASRVSRTTVIELEAPFHSAGAAMIFFDPQPVIEQCAARLSREFITEELVAEAQPPGRVFNDWLTGLKEETGAVQEWMIAALEDTPLELHAHDRRMWLGLHFSGFDFDHVSPQRWAKVIATHDAMFAQSQAPKIQDTLNENIEKLRQRTRQRLDAAVDELPQRPDLYPGGLNASRQLLRRLDDWLEERLTEVESIDAGASPDFERQLAHLAKEAQGIPDLRPFALRLFLLGVMVFYLVEMSVSTLGDVVALSAVAGWLAGGAAALIAMLASVFWLHRKERHLVALREACIRTSEARHARDLETHLRRKLADLVRDLRNKVLESQQRLGDLEASLRELTAEAASLPSQPTSPFRLRAADEAVTDWAYQRWRSSTAEMRRPLLAEQRLLRGWQSLEASALRDRLLTFSRQQFAAIRSLTLTEALRHRQDEGTKAISVLKRSSTPLLRPNFDSLGGGRYAQLNQIIILPPGGTPIRGQILDENWEVVEGIHPRLLIALRVRHLLPLASLEAVQHRAIPTAIREESI